MVLEGEGFTQNLPMEVKQILKKIRQPKEKKQECFFALQIGPELIKSAIWAVETGQVKILSLEETKGWQSEKELLEAVDASLSSAVENLAPSQNFEEPNKVVLGLSPDWVEENKIIPTKLLILKKIAKELGLNFTGFAVSNEAVVFQLKSVEGIPPTVILVYLGKSKILVSLVNLGKIVGSELVDQSGDLGADLIEGLSRISPEGVYPARILIYGDEKKLEEARQELVSYSWHQADANFLHLPKLEVLNSDFEIKAIALAGGREMAGVMKLEEEKPEEEAPKKEETDELEEKPETLGFVKGKDIKEKIQPKFKLKLPRLRIPRFNFAWLKIVNLNFFTRILAKLTKVFPRRFPLKVGLIVALVFIFIGVLAALFWFLPKAEVTLFVKPKLLEKAFTVKLDPELKTIDSENLVLPAEKLQVSLEGEKTGGTTGTKLVGEPAQGEVTIYNGTSQEKTFTGGTIIKSSSGIEFTLDDDATVASQSGTAAEPDPGKATIAATAVEIGTESNLASETNFTVANYSQSDYVAKNDSSFSGGTSREVQVVDKKDQERLVKELAVELEKEAEGKLATKVTADKRLIEDSLTSQVVSKSFNQKVGEETTEVKLTLKVKSSALSFSETDFRNLIEEEVQRAVPDGFEYKTEESEVAFSLDELTDDDKALFSAHFKANLIPILDLEQIKKNLVGKRMVIARTYLTNLPNVDSFKAQIKPPLPDKLATFPRIMKNIKIEKELE